MSMAELLRQEWRITILVTLRELPGNTAYEGLLETAIGRYHNQFLSREQIQGELEWLRDAGLVTLQDHPSRERRSYTATLTEKGDAVAGGRVNVAGVRRPRG